MTPLDFDPNEYDQADSLEPVPPGRYKVRVARIKAKPAFVGYDTRRNYDIGLEITEGEYAGRQLLESLTLHAGKSEKQTDYSRSRLKNLMWACYLDQLLKGVEDLQDRECEVEAWIDEGIDRTTGEKKFERRNKHKYIIPADFERPVHNVKSKPKPESTAKAKGAAEPKPEGAVVAKSETDLSDDIPF